MNRRAPASPFFVVVVVCCASVAISLPAQGADPTKAECIASNEKAQELRRSGKLTAARELLPTCVAASCPAALREDCAQRLSEIESAMPDIVFQVTDTAGNDLAAVRVTMDGRPLVDRVGGSSIAVDPGEHQFGFQSDGKRSVEKTLIIREHDKARIEKVVLEALPKLGTSAQREAPPPSMESAPSGSKQISPLVFVAGGVGIVGIGAGVALALAEGSKHAALEGECNGNACPPSAQGDLDAFHTLRAASIVGYGIGALGLVGAGVFYFTASTSRPETSTARVWIGPSSIGATETF
jgi:hypothetical protein